MSAKKKTLLYLEKQITLMTLAIEKTEELLMATKKEREHHLRMYERTINATEKSMEDLVCYLCGKTIIGTTFGHFLDSDEKFHPVCPECHAKWAITVAGVKVTK
jgi:hypothetical protein